MFNSRIVGLGKYLPDNVVTNDDLAKIMDTSDEWIVERTGINERRHIVKGSDDSPSTMAFEASKLALERAGIKNNLGWNYALQAIEMGSLMKDLN